MKILKWDYEPGGMCPVQAEGTFLGYYFYFRSRWDKATIEFARSITDWEEDRLVRRYILKTFPMFEAGYVNPKIAKRLIYKGFFLFAIRWPSIGI